MWLIHISLAYMYIITSSARNERHLYLHKCVTDKCGLLKLRFDTQLQPSRPVVSCYFKLVSVQSFYIHSSSSVNVVREVNQAVTSQPEEKGSKRDCTKQKSDPFWENLPNARILFF